MTTHDRDKVIAIAEQVKANNDMFGDFSVALYAIAFEAGRQAEREDIATSLMPYDKPNKTEVELMADAIAFRLVEAIRARGDTK